MLVVLGILVGLVIIKFIFKLYFPSLAGLSGLEDASTGSVNVCSLSENEWTEKGVK